MTSKGWWVTCRRRCPRGHTKPSYLVGSSAVVGFFVASVSGPKAGVAEEARTRGFATPAFAGCAFVGGVARLEIHRVLGGVKRDLKRLVLV
jgi:hypothetical protein